MTKAKKKKTVHTNKITPAVAISNGVLFDKLVGGECFLMNGSLYMKETSDDQIGINLSTGKYEDCFCGTQIVPVTVTIAWKKK